MKWSKLPKLTPDEPTPPRDPAASMSLINDVIRHPLDPSYEAAAAKKRGAHLGHPLAPAHPGDGADRFRARGQRADAAHPAR